MIGLALPRDRLSVLCLGAHSDDIEIGASGTLLALMEQGVKLDVRWCVLSGGGQRADEAGSSAEDILRDAASAEIELQEFRDGYFNHQGAELKDWFEGLKSRANPDLIFTHRREDAHQDHRELAQLTWNSFRNHLILEYEIPKWDGDLGTMNTYVPLSPNALERKVETLMRHFGSQRSKDWFDRATFEGLARLRGMECRAASGYAEAFVMRKAQLLPGL